MIYIILILVGFGAGILSGAVGFGGGMILLPILTYYYGVEIAIPISTIAQLMSNLSKVGLGFKSIQWKSVQWFLICAIPFTILGVFGFSILSKPLMTRILSISLILFAILKLRGKMNLPKGRNTLLIGGGITGLINGLLGISGPLSSAVFLSIDLAPVSYIASEATAAAAMHIIKIFMYNKLDYMTLQICIEGLIIGSAMIVGNYIAMKRIKNIKKKKYKKLVAFVMIVASIWLFISA